MLKDIDVSKTVLNTCKMVFINIERDDVEYLILQEFEECVLSDINVIFAIQNRVPKVYLQITKYQILGTDFFDYRHELVFEDQVIESIKEYLGEFETHIWV